MTPIVLLGEKDHGKSTLIGRLIFETNSMPLDRLESIRETLTNAKKKFEWAHLLDSFRYEREHKMTLDTTRVVIHIDKVMYEFIDVPGHKRLIKNMLTGASGAQFAILVIDIQEGIRAQTVRHLKIAKFLGIEKIIIVINKCDLTNYSENKFIKRSKELITILGPIGYTDAKIIPITAFNGDNVLIPSQKMAWYSGHTLCEVIKHTFVQTQNEKDSDIAIAIQDVLDGKIIGKVLSGRVRVNDKLTVYPSKKETIVRELQVGKTSVTSAPVQSPISITLSNSSDIRRGDVLIQGHPICYSNEVNATCIFLKDPIEEIMIDANFNTSKAKILKKVKKYDPVSAPFKLQNKIPILSKFTVLKNTEIIGVCKVLGENEQASVYQQ